MDFYGELNPKRQRKRTKSNFSSKVKKTEIINKIEKAKKKYDADDDKEKKIPIQILSSAIKARYFNYNLPLFLWFL